MAEAQDLVGLQNSVAAAMLLELEQRFIALPSGHTRPLGARWSSTLIGHWIRDLRAAGSGWVSQQNSPVRQLQVKGGGGVDLP